MLIIIKLHIAVVAFMPVMSLIVLPLLPPAMTACLDCLGFFKAAFVTGIFLFTRCCAGSRYSYFSIVPIMRLFAVYCVASGAFIPVFVIIMLHGKIVAESRYRAAALGANDRSCAGGLRSGVTAVVTGRPVSGEGQVVFAHGVVVIPHRAVSLVPAGEEVAGPFVGLNLIGNFPVLAEIPHRVFHLAAIQCKGDLVVVTATRFFPNNAQRAACDIEA